ncbi:hypothetical protein PK98_14685 [Croceibacterium mercuriale]|uniref:Acylneuraminate cytidylyltransferase n=1 Tax=Croceibacterium mercuriale TaxID=1572751 RepID=A0A0B2BS83_9SPHN|nr:hypothetical protein [Croceibacterium mercuriale]KHL24229.1 hypothetical protein PK98_14685 [Croceibacterium mercuriale]
MQYIGFIPCRSGSERVPNKNTRPFAGFTGGLLELKLRQMAEIPELESILVSSNDPIVLDATERYAHEVDDRIVPLERPDEYGRSSTSMDDFILYIAQLRATGTIFWSHVTSPFITSSIYRDGLATYEQALSDGHDCLVSVTRTQRFFWTEQGPVNYDNTVEKWPRSQDLTPLLEINHALYVMPFKSMREVGDRIGRQPYFYDIDEHDAADIDWEPQFVTLEKLALLKRQAGEGLI